MMPPVSKAFSGVSLWQGAFWWLEEDLATIIGANRSKYALTSEALGGRGVHL